jgi:hypothetical protein
MPTNDFPTADVNGFDLNPINLYMQMRDAGELSRVAAE